MKLTPGLNVALLPTQEITPEILACALVGGMKDEITKAQATETPELRELLKAWPWSRMLGLVIDGDLSEAPAEVRKHFAFVLNCLSEISRYWYTNRHTIPEFDGLIEQLMVKYCMCNDHRNKRADLAAADRGFSA